MAKTNEIKNWLAIQNTHAPYCVMQFKTNGCTDREYLTENLTEIKTHLCNAELARQTMQDINGRYVTVPTEEEWREIFRLGYRNRNCGNADIERLINLLMGGHGNDDGE